MLEQSGACGPRRRKQGQSSNPLSLSTEGGMSAAGGAIAEAVAAGAQGGAGVVSTQGRVCRRATETAAAGQALEAGAVGPVRPAPGRGTSPPQRAAVARRSQRHPRATPAAVGRRPCSAATAAKWAVG